MSTETDAGTVRAASSGHGAPVPARGGAEVPAIGEPGRAALELGAGRPPRQPDSADYELSACDVPGAHVRAASVRGLLHRYRGQPRQDRYSVVFDAPTATLIVTVCDGVGQFTLSQEAAAFVATDAPRAYLVHGNWPDAIAEVNERLSGFVADAPARLRLDPPGAGTRMATTLAAAAIQLDCAPLVASTAWTDDTAVWLLAREWTNLTPEPGEDPTGLYSGRVRALPNAAPLVHSALVPVDGRALFVLTDGVGVPLAGSRQVRDVLARWWAGPPDVFTFAQQVGFARKGHMDDRTVVGVWFEPA